MTSSRWYGKDDGGAEGVWKPRFLDDVICERSLISSSTNFQRGSKLKIWNLIEINDSNLNSINSVKPRCWTQLEVRSTPGWTPLNQYRVHRKFKEPRILTVFNGVQLISTDFHFLICWSSLNSVKLCWTPLNTGKLLWTPLKSVEFNENPLNN